MIQHTDQYAQLRNHFEAYLQTRQPSGIPDSLYSPIRYINNLGGKRIRPLLVLLGYKLFREDIEKAMSGALALEYFHNFSLMHDDIMDHAPLRRGKETVHEKYGVNVAILSGDALLIKSYQLINEAGQNLNISAKLAERLSEAALEICEGQQLDMDFEKLDAPTEDEYLQMIRQKTAVLLGFSLEVGGRLAGASEENVSHLYSIGQLMGLGFQIQDDYLDVFGDTTLTGKQKGGDILRGKKNFPYVLYYNLINEEKRFDFCKTYAQAASTHSIEEIMKLYDTHNIEEMTKLTFQNYFTQGLEELQNLPGHSKDGLAEIFQLLIQRKF